MAHPEHFAFVRSIRERFPEFFVACSVLDFGSRDFNGGVRELFDDCTYVGVDCQPGKGVDVVCLAHEYDGPMYDVVIWCEALEHDPHWRKTLDNALHHLTPGGLFVATWASPTRPEHGTIRSARAEEPEVYGPDPNYYQGVGAGEFRGAVAGRLHDLEVTTARNDLDVYAVGFR